MCFLALNSTAVCAWLRSWEHVSLAEFRKAMKFASWENISDFSDFKDLSEWGYFIFPVNDHTHTVIPTLLL